jgi:hypothetical protein
VYLERHVQAMNFHTWVYCIVVTVTSVGYGKKDIYFTLIAIMCNDCAGDVAPQTTWGRFAMMVFICYAIIYVPKQSNELVEVLVRRL